MGEQTSNSGEASCPTRCSDGYSRAVLTVQGKISRATGAVGAYVARRPVLVISLSILATAAAAAGWARFKIESATDVLWVPQDTKPQRDEDWVKTIYGAGGGYAQFFATVNPKQKSAYGDNALQLPIFWEMFQVDAAVRNITVMDGDKKYGWEQICTTKFDGSCKYSSSLHLWNMSFSTFLAAVNGSATDPTAGNRDAVIGAVNQIRFPDNTPVSTLSIFGGISLSPLPNPPPGAPDLYMSAARVVSMSYSMRDGVPDAVLKNWYKEYINLLKARTEQLQHASLAYLAGNSVELEIGNSVTADLYLIVIAVLIFILVAVVGMSRFHLVATRSSLALLGVVSAIMALVAGYGLAMLFGCPFTTLAETLPFVLLGLSIDCMFILSKAYDHVVAGAPAASLEERFRSLMSSAGTSVVVTLLASAVAFALGAISELPSVRWFSVYATMGVVCILVATMTFLVGVMVLTERRIARNRLDCCCCATSGGPPLPTAARAFLAAPAGAGCCANTVQPGMAPPNHMCAPSRAAVAESAEQVSDFKTSAVPVVACQDPTRGGSPRQHPAPLSDEEAEPNLMKKLFSRYYAPFLTKWYGKVFVLAIFTGWIVLSGVGIPKLKLGQPLSELAPDTSYLQDYVKVMDDTFNKQIGSPTGLYFRWLDPAPPAQQERMLRALTAVLDCPYTNATISAFQGNWLLDFIEWVQSNHPEVTLEALPGCVNPFVTRTSGDLGKFVSPKPIKGCIPEKYFYPLLDKFLDVSRGYRDDLQWVYVPGNNGSRVPSFLWSHRFPAVHTAEGDNDAYSKDSLKAVKEVEREVNQAYFAAANADTPDDVFFMYNGNYIYGEGDAIMASMTTEYVLLAVAGVGLVLTLTLPSVRAVVMMMIAVGMVDFFLFGEMFILNIRFNQVSIINMIMATGLSVDYSVYFAQRFVAVTADGTLNGRMAMALSDTGSAVFVGGLTALAGTIPLAFASSTILRTFFALIFGTICFALLIGLMLMPVVFSLVGPPPPKQGADESVAPAGGKGGDEFVPQKQQQQLQQFQAPQQQSLEMGGGRKGGVDMV
ncbi:hypothetical protein Agub_g4689 [Astrephomene gubernaculifera]|uniref:SSD domain-containing protein n=1 Tax=Astrephomene gubernaculifera TaxID=47775 RepID=A0AAD3DMQ2_9CHLO|nr:hypothetical protein Agub_g4689 [Astrephomene gubernaculifera]